ncbi:uncharacterized protein CDV56_108866 [Aspergillus thermomutatus]|uniref:Azaphilone pigments biosynthesis cluster protein L N-terminal domain-containing protein n=1 Tax=Aspergillus thermomutatus TaxID=41047 RepID=A0A397HL26_ASPTH|nr:uncharacterized protein CDV56_108866 [Aspergillus thermomutatus]RHZ63789.1 hypothetical protein CDV56_108866 [Aspergillus thermomutatus]
MADPLSITAGIVGIAVPALQGLRLLLHDLQSIRDAPETISNLKDNIRAIELALISLQAISEQEWESLGTTVADEAKATIATCTKACEIFRSNLQRWTGHSQDGNGRLSRLDRAKVGIFKQGQIKSMCEQLQSCKITINSVVSIATLYSSLRHTHLTEEMKKTIAMRQTELEAAIRTTDDQIADIRTRREEIDLVDGTQAAADPETEADMLRQLDEEHKTLYISRRLLNELMTRVQESTIVNVVARNENNSTRVTFGSQNSGLQIGVSNGPITGITFGRMSV